MRFPGEKFENGFSNPNTDFAFFETIQKQIINPKYLGAHENIMYGKGLISIGRKEIERQVLLY